MESMLYSRTQSTVKKKVRKHDDILIAFDYRPVLAGDGPPRGRSAPADSLLPMRVRIRLNAMSRKTCNLAHS
jgi:hypothetical protein